ncbi:MAG: DUF4976 domain-containing protein [Planctomycetaceae bacterium]
MPTPSDIFPPRAGKPAWAQRIDNWTKGPGGEPMFRDRTLQSWVHQYHQAVRAIDEGVGRVLERSMRRLSVRIRWSCSLPIRALPGVSTAFVTRWPRTTRTSAPMIVSMPGRVPEGSVCRTPVGGIDLVPTFFGLAGIDVPGDARTRSAAAPVKSGSRVGPSCPADQHRATVRVEHKQPSDRRGRLLPEHPWYVMLREQRYKYVRPMVAGEQEELYDLQNDPDELKNLSAQPEHQQTLHRMRDSAITELRRTHAGFVDNLPPVE